MYKKFLVILLLLSPTHAYGEKWYVLASPTDRVVAELDLKPGATEIIKIQANKPTMVGFMAKISQNKMQHYKSINIKPIIVTYAPEKITMYGIGGGQAVLPINGEIILEVKNNANESILVDIFKGE